MATEITLPALSHMTGIMPAPASNGGVLFAGCPELIGTPSAYSREEEVYGEGEDAEFVYKVVQGSCPSMRWKFGVELERPSVRRPEVELL